MHPTVSHPSSPTLVRNAFTTKKYFYSKYKLTSHREVGIPEAISHLLSYPDVFSGATFENIYTTHLLNHLKAYNNGQEDLTPTDLGDSSIVRIRKIVSIVTLFDDYAHRGPVWQTCAFTIIARWYTNLPMLAESHSTKVIPCRRLTANSFEKTPPKSRRC
jgi:hypothetical protein